MQKSLVVVAALSCLAGCGAEELPSGSGDKADDLSTSQAVQYLISTNAFRNTMPQEVGDVRFLDFQAGSVSGVVKLAPKRDFGLPAFGAFEGQWQVLQAEGNQVRVRIDPSRRWEWEDEEDDLRDARVWEMFPQGLEFDLTTGPRFEHQGEWHHYFVIPTAGEGEDHWFVTCSECDVKDYQRTYELAVTRIALAEDDWDLATAPDPQVCLDGLCVEPCENEAICESRAEFDRDILEHELASITLEVHELDLDGYQFVGSSSLSEFTSGAPEAGARFELTGALEGVSEIVFDVYQSHDGDDSSVDALPPGHPHAGGCFAACAN